MKIILSVVASLLLAPAVALCSPILSATATQTGGTLIDFEGQTDGANADNLYVGLGVTFSATVGNTRIWDPLLGGNQVASSGTGVLGPTGPNTDPISIHFNSGQSFVEFFFADPNVFGGTSYTLTAFDGSNNVLESLLIPSSSLPGNFYTGFARTSADILRVAIDPSNGGENFSVDDLRFGNTAAVPEPATLTLVGLGWGVLAARRRMQGARRR